ncbi:MAG: V-type ATP synthase subunit A, partial [Hallerella succinigenes]|nr:V-type ATP synthase subunit A [Hallerella succinigenes]
TLKVVGAFLGLSRERSDQRRFPAIHPLESWSKYEGIIESAKVEEARHILAAGNDVNQMMKVVGEEGTSIEDFITYLKSEYLDSVYLQQDAYHEIDAACSADRQKYVFDRVYKILKTPMEFADKDSARGFFLKLTQATKDWNRVAFDSNEFKSLEEQIFNSVAEVTKNV